MKLFFVPLLAATAVMALATDPPLPELSNLTSTAVLAWYAWHTATRTLPKLIDDFRSELSTQRAQHRFDLESFLHEMTNERTQRHADSVSMTHALGELSTAISRTNSSTTPK
ncbi:MAG TPA: hypothetical protein VGJ15_12285 [Pirellulales bacterium]|jgi:hypothetical protein